MKKVYLTFIGLFLISSTVIAAESVYEWGSWQDEDDIVAAILAGADPTEVTEPTAAGPGAPGTAAQAIVPVAFDNVSITQEGMPKDFGGVQTVTVTVVDTSPLIQSDDFGLGTSTNQPSSDPSGRNQESTIVLDDPTDPPPSSLPSGRGGS